MELMSRAEKEQVPFEEYFLWWVKNMEAEMLWFQMHQPRMNRLLSRADASGSTFSDLQFMTRAQALHKESEFFQRVHVELESMNSSGSFTLSGGAL
jgi:hypothetical protein